MKSLLLLLFLSVNLVASAQAGFQQLSFAKALEQAGEEGKLIFLQFESANCAQCNEVADKGLNNKELAEELAPSFILLKIPPTHPDREAIGSRYNMQQGFGSLYINAEGTLVHKFASTTSSSKHYAEQSRLAIEKAGETLKVSELENEYKSGNKSIGFIEALLLKRQSLNLSTDSLLQEYVQLLPADSQKTLRTLVFIARMAPELGSRANSILRADRALFNQAWNTMKLPERVQINNAVITKSLNKAIAQKSEADARNTARFAMSTYQGNVEAGAKSYAVNMLQFFEQINDTSMYFINAIPYYNRYYMTVNVDSVKRADSVKKTELLNEAPLTKTVISSTSYKNVKSISFAPRTQAYTNALNHAARNFYKMTSQPQLLLMAIGWIEKGLEFYESAEALDTYARLLYKSGQQTRAVDVQLRAIALKTRQGYPVKEMEAVLEKMRRKAAIDD